MDVSPYHIAGLRDKTEEKEENYQVKITMEAESVPRERRLATTAN